MSSLLRPGVLPASADPSSTLPTERLGDGARLCYYGIYAIRSWAQDGSCLQVRSSFAFESKIPLYFI